MCVYIYIYTHAIFSFIHSFIDGHLGYFHTLAIVNNPVMNTRVQISPWDNNFIFFQIFLKIKNQLNTVVAYSLPKVFHK